MKVKVKIIEFDDLMLEADGYALMDKIDDMRKHINSVIPKEVLYTPAGEVNMRTKWGSVLLHLSMAHNTLKVFL